MVEETKKPPNDSTSNGDSSMCQMKKHGREEQKSTGHAGDMPMVHISDDSINRQGKVSDRNAAPSSEGKSCPIENELVARRERQDESSME